MGEESGQIIVFRTSVVNAYVNRSWLYADAYEPTSGRKALT
jgi:hypothetical protein